MGCDMCDMCAWVVTCVTCVCMLHNTQLKPGHCSREQLVATSFLLLVAGNATVASQINLGVISLLQVVTG